MGFFEVQLDSISKEEIAWHEDMKKSSVNHEISMGLFSD